MTEKIEVKLALAHDFLTVWGGAERVFRVMAEMYPEAPIYTLFYDQRFMRHFFPGREIRASFLQRWPKWLRESGFGRLFYPVAVETLDLRDFDTVLSSSGAWMKGLVTRLHTQHIAYLHSPMRYVWDTFHSHPELRHGFRFFQRLVLSYFRLWDKAAADRPDVLIANSRYTQARIAKYYRREALVITPPVLLPAVNQSLAREREYFLAVARLTPAKHVDVVIEAFNKLGLPLLVVGTGREAKHLRSMAEANITFVGAVSDERLATLYSGARALVQASEEDFGLAAAEAFLSGTPVIGYRAGALQEWLEPGIHGEYFDELVPEAVADGVRRFQEHERQYSTEVLRTLGQRFTRPDFERAVREQVGE